jgi:ribosomal protein S21
MSSHIEAKRKKGESFDALLRRFTRRMQQSGKQLDVKSGRYWIKTPKKNKVQDSALRKLVKGARRAYMLKTGKVTEEELRAKKR